MDHGFVDVFAYQEALLVMAVFGVAILTMIWVGFRRWLQHKERMGRLIAEQTAESAAQYSAHMERVEARLAAMEQFLPHGDDQKAAEIGGPGTDTIPKPNQVQTNP